MLLDEIEKAHPEVFNVLLQVIEDGRLTDSHGRVIDFKNTILVMTSNVGSDVINKSVNFGFTKGSENEESAETYESLKSRLMDVLKGTFRPEFLNRIDDIVVFKPLGRKEIRQIVDLQIKKTERLLLQQRMNLEVASSVRDFIAKEGYDQNLGARPIRRFIQNEIENKISDKIINGEIESGDIIVVVLKGKKIDVNVKVSVETKSLI